MLNPAPGVFDLDEAAPCFVGSVAGLETGVLEPLGCHYVEFFRADPPELVQVVPRFYTELLDCPGATCRNIRISTCPIRIRNLFNRWTGPLPIHPIHNPPITYRAQSPHPVSAAPSCPKRNPRVRVPGPLVPSRACSYPALAREDRTSPLLAQSSSVAF